jgi:hypothetical protein
MHVGKEVFDERTNHFLDIKYKELCLITESSDTRYLFYTADSFSRMIKHFKDDPRVGGVRVYFANYPAGDPSVPPGYENKLTIIFAPTDPPLESSGELYIRELGKYYHVPPKGTFDPINCLLNRTIASKWIASYQSYKKRHLDIIKPIAKKGETKSIWYSIAGLTDITEEMACQKATGIKAYFVVCLDNDEAHPNRMMLHFVLTSKIGDEEVDFFLEFTEGWDHRKPAGDLDTGNPCPPATCNGEEMP